MADPRERACRSPDGNPTNARLVELYGEMTPSREPWFEGNVAIVTGAGRGIGRGIAIEFARRDATLFLVDKDKDPLTKTSDMILAHLPNATVRTLVADIADSKDQMAIFANAWQFGGRLDVLVNNAAIVSIGDADGYGIKVNPSEDEWRQVFEVNYWANIQLAKMAAQLMYLTDSRGAIINMSSVHAAMPRGEPHYSGAKAALEAFTNEYAVVCGPFGIRVLCVRPGAIATSEELSLEAMQRAAHFQNEIPLGRMGYPVDVAQLVAFLASDLAGYLTGGHYDVAGGLPYLNWVTAEMLRRTNQATQNGSPHPLASVNRSAFPFLD